jgi:phosphoenolpyruvate-protein phosphotransferase
MAVGRLVLLGGVSVEADVEQSVVEGTVEESLARLTAAIAASRDEIGAIATAARERIGAEHAAIIEAQLLVLDDPEWYDPVVAAIRAGATPTAAAWATTQEIAAVLSSLDDPYLRERSADVLDVGQRIIGHLTGSSRTEVLSDLSGAVVIGAHELTPTDTLGLDLEFVRGLITEVGARTSHAAIIARQLGIPAVVGATGLLEFASNGNVLVVDGDAGICTVNPEPDLVDRARASEASRAERVVVREKVTTRDGVPVLVYANATSPQDVERAVRWGADGIGLFRTEFFFMQSDGLPGEDAQAAYYGAAAEAAGGRPITFRTLDIGGDKPVPGLQVEAEENPFLGVRGVRLTLAHRGIFDDQLRALARTAARYPDVSVMVPMVSGLEELDEVRAVLDDVAPAAAFRFGTMVEVPSVAVLAAELAEEVDFLSVGTNDLTAYLLAADRGNKHLHYLYTEFHPAALRVLHQILARAGTTPVSVCGEVAGDPRSLPLLVGLGFRCLSVSGPLVSEIKRRIRRLDAVSVARIATSVLVARRHVDVEAVLDELSALEESL